MKLCLYWKDIENNTYSLGTLSKDNNNYFFILNIEEYEKALRNGCPGIGNLGKGNQKSDQLFQFFRERIPGKDNPRVKEVLKMFKMESYDDMELLKRSKGMVNTDRFHLKEV